MSFVMAEDESSVQMQTLSASPQLKPPYDRLSMPDAARVSYASSLAIFTGAILGVAQGARMEALRFRAENAHRLPSTTKGWYLYHKSKNYAVMWHGIKEGARMGGKLGFWVGLFFCSEILIDRIWNKRKDFRSTMATGVMTALAWSRVYAMTGQATRKIVMSGLKAGFAYGVLQDGMALLDGRFDRYPSIFASKATNSSDS